MKEWAAAEPWLIELRRRHWTLFCHPNRKVPDVIGAIHLWQADQCADIVIIHGPDRAVAYRTPISPRTDPLAPVWIHWWFARDNAPDAAEAVLRAVLNLGAPPKGYHHLNPAPPSCQLPPEQRRPLTIAPL